MPIEDIDFLKKHSKRQSYMFLVDSAARDRAVHATPSEYTVQFTSPFQNVIGFEVLQGSIPRTMYNIDLFNNTISFLIYEDTPEHRAKREDPLRYYHTVSLTPGEYSIQTLVVELNRVLRMPLNGEEEQNIIDIVATTETNPPELTNKLRFHCAYPFVFNMNHSSAAETLGFDLYAKQNFINLPIALLNTQQPYVTVEYPSVSLLYNGFVTASINAGVPFVNSNIPFADQPYFTQQRFHNVIQTLNSEFQFNITDATLRPSLTPSAYIEHLRTNVIPKNFKLFHSVDLPASQTLGEETIIFDGPRGVVRRIPITPTQFVAQQFSITEKKYLTQVFAALTTTDGTITNDSKAIWRLYEDANGKPGDEIPLRTTASNLLSNGCIIPISFTDGGLSDPAEKTFNLLMPGTYWIGFESENTDTFIFYNDVPVYQQNGKMMTYNGTEWVQFDGMDGIHFEASIRIVMQDEYHSLTAPGIFTLIGERYVILRCPEIEENSYRSLAYSKNCLGLAKFQLGVVGYSENRLDFSTIPMREFHPIGRLQKLTFRFETLQGKLYDFKGVNHNLTCAIHYYEPMQVSEFNQSILNPNYQADLLTYMYRQDDQDADSEDEYDEDDVQEYRMQEARHLPDSVRRMDYEALSRMQLDEIDE